MIYTEFTVSMYEVRKGSTAADAQFYARPPHRDSPALSGKCDLADDAAWEEFLTALGEALTAQRTERLGALAAEADRMLDEAIALRGRVRS